MRPSNPKWIALDVETTGKDWTVCKPHGLGVSYIRGQAKYYLWKDIPKQVIADIENPNINKIGHNLHNYDAKVIRKSGIDIKGLFHGTEVIWNLVDSGLPQLDLKYLADRFIGTDSLEGKRELDSYIKSVHAGHIGGLCALDITCDGNPHLPIIAKYCEEDVNNTVELFYKGTDRIKEMQDMVLKMGFKKGPLDYYREEAAPLEYVLFDIEYKGIRVALDKIEEVRKENINKAQELVDYLNKSLRNRLPKVEAELYAKAMSELAPKAKQKTRDAIEANKGKMFTWSNPNHFACLLYKYCGLLPPYIYKTKKGKYQTDKMAIQGLLAAPIPKRLKEILRVYQDYKKCLKIISTYTGDSKSC
jgi:DNA polymerase I-like protein with 3'-5' exonuclease and polymerase domains